MPVTINVNGLTITHKGSGGSHKNSAPDVCKTPGKGVPVAYAITAVNTDIAQGTTTVLADGGNMIANKPSIFTRCTGDEAGSMGGVVSGTTASKSEWITYSPNVFMEGQNVCRLTDKLFMNSKNTICGQTGQGESLIGGDEVLTALCDIFCEGREEWHNCRRNPPSGGCTRPSTLAKNRTRAALDTPGSPLRNAVRTRFPGAVGAAERSLYAAADAIGDTARKVYTQQGLRDSLERAVRRAIGEAGIEAAQRMGRRFWMRVVPGLNVLGLALDIYDGAMAANDIYQAIRSLDDIMDNAIRVQPDFSVIGADGAVEEIYDFKFDAPGYQDTFSDEQADLYRDLTGRDPIAVDNATCDCDTRRGPPSVGMS